MESDFEISDLPGSELVNQGIIDLENNLESEESLLILVAAHRLRNLGFKITAAAVTDESPEHRLYRLIEKRKGDGAHSYYNSLLRRMVSFARAYSVRSTCGVDPFKTS